MVMWEELEEMERVLDQANDALVSVQEKEDSGVGQDGARDGQGGGISGVLGVSNNVTSAEMSFPGLI